MAGHKINRRQMLLRTATWGAAAFATQSSKLHGASLDQPTLRARPFALQDVRLLEGPFRDAMQRDAAYLLKLEPDRFLSNFLETAGLTPKAPVYGGWESKVGRMLGHYLSACSMMHASTGDSKFL